MGAGTTDGASFRTAASYGAAVAAIAANAPGSRIEGAREESPAALAHAGHGGEVAPIDRLESAHDILIREGGSASVVVPRVKD